MFTITKIQPQHKRLTPHPCRPANPDLWLHRRMRYKQTANVLANIKELTVVRIGGELCNHDFEFVIVCQVPTCSVFLFSYRIIEEVTLIMAFMMPVVKNDWDIYKSNRSRRVSECSNPRSCRSRKVSECKSEGPSLSTSPGSDFIVGSPGHRSVPNNMSSRQYSRASSRTSQSSLQSPCKSASSSPPKNGSQSSLNKFHNRLLDKLKRSLRSKDDNERTSS